MALRVLRPRLWNLLWLIQISFDSKGWIFYLALCSFESICIIVLCFFFFTHFTSWSFFFQHSTGYWYQCTKDPGIYVMSTRSTELVLKVFRCQLWEVRMDIQKRNELLSLWWTGISAFGFTMLSFEVPWYFYVSFSTFSLPSCPFGLHFQWQLDKTGWMKMRML
jgi:hypothetical protein